MTMDDRDGVIWFDGKLVPWREAKVHVLTHTLHYGMGVFEAYALITPTKARQFSAYKITRAAYLTQRIF